MFINLLVIALTLLVLYFKNYFRAVYLAFKLPGPPALAVLGNVLIVIDSKKLEDIGTRISTLYTPVARIWISIVPFFVVYEPKHLQIILSSNKYTTKNMFYTFLHNLIGDGLITNSGKKWKQHRKLIQPYFHISTLKVFFEAFYKSSKILVKELSGQTDVNITIYANRFVLDVLQDTVLGIPAKYDPAVSPYRKGKVFVPFRITRPWLLLDSFFKRTKFSKEEAQHRDHLQNYTKNILESKKQNVMNHNSCPNNLMEMMLEISKANPEFTDEDIINEACTFMLAGQDSVGAGLTFSLYFLAVHQNIQEKVLDELNVIFEGTDRPSTFEDVCEMKYLEQCIKEALRLCPSVPILARKVTEDLPLGKHTIPAGTNIFLSPFATHRLPHIYPNPLEFDPERFSPENKEKIHPYGYIPFSAGPRNCIGYKFALIELKTVLSQILRNYHVSLKPGFEKLNLSYRITLKASKGIWIRLQKRSMS